MNRWQVRIAIGVAVLVTMGVTCRGEGPFVLDIRDHPYELVCLRVPPRILGDVYYRTPSDGYLPILARTISGVQPHEALAVRFTAAHCVGAPTQRFWLMRGDAGSARMQEIRDMLASPTPGE